MTLEQILEEWKKDCVVDKLALDEESLKTISLHCKYIELYKKEKLAFIKLKQDYNKLHLAKYEFYFMGPDEETQKLGWELPPRGKVIKGDVQMYMDGDQDIINANLKLAMAQEKVDLLVEIVKEVQNRRWAIKNAIDFMKWNTPA